MQDSLFDVVLGAVIVGAGEGLARALADHLHVLVDAAVEQSREARVLDLELHPEELELAVLLEVALCVMWGP